MKPAYRLYQCSDGKWIFIACGNDTFWGKLCIALEMEEFTVNPRFRDAPWSFTPEDHETVKKTIGEKISKEPQAYWVQYFDEHDVPAAPADSRDDFLVDPQVLSDNILVQIDDPMLGIMTQLGPPVKVTGIERLGAGSCPGTWGARGGCAVRSGIWRDGVCQAGEIGGVDLLTSPFSNVKVVDLSSYIAGALCPGLLADFGASVIKVESLTGDPFRSLGPTFQDWNRGKRSICVLTLRLKRGGGRSIVSSKMPTWLWKTTGRELPGGSGRTMRRSAR